MIAFDAMGTRVVLDAADGGRTARELFAEVEATCSRFRPDSAISRLNRDPRPEVEVPPLLAGVLHRAAELRRRTDGLVDPAVGGAVAAWGYDRTFVEMVGGDRPSVVPPAGDWAVEGIVVRREPGTVLDLGGIAKGWTCDLAVERGMATIVSAGGDVRSADPETTVEIADPWEETALTVTLGIGALATSSVARRRWRVGDVEAHHIIDPRTLRPARSPVLSASVLAATAAEAEAGAKAVLLLGTEGLAWAERRSWIAAALVVWHDGSVYATRGWEVAA